MGQKSANNVGRERLQSELTSRELLCVWLSERIGTTIMSQAQSESEGESEDQDEGNGEGDLECVAPPKMR